MNRRFWRSIASMLLLGAGLAAACAGRAAGYGAGLIDLSPQRYAVPPVPHDVARPLPALPDDAAASDAVTDDEPPEHAGAAYEWIPYDALFPGHALIADETGLSGGPLLPSDTADLFAPPPSRGLDTWSLGARHWRYLSSAGFGLTVGNTASDTPAWGQSVSLAGVGLYRSRPSGALQARSWDYAVAAGALDAQTGQAPAEGDLSYGPVAVDASARYALDRRLSVATRLQRAPDLTALGLGGTYSLGEFGAWRFGLSGARQAQQAGWRRRLGYTLGLSPGLDLSWINMRQGLGYADLASYGEAGCDCVRNQWQLDLAAGRWGSFSGSFERQVSMSGELDQRLGLTHGFRYGPYLRVRLETTRDLNSGDYGWGARFSLPLY
jgi:hypothetical protein